MSDLPTGTVTFCLTDVEGSTRLWESRPDAMRRALARHDALVRRAVAEHGGHALSERGEGDSLFCVFARADAALRAAVALQEAFSLEDWPDGLALRVRLALHTGEADARDGGYYGAAVNRCARLREIGWGGQILLSEATAALVQDSLPPDVFLHDLSLHSLRDLSRAERVFEAVPPHQATPFPRLKSLDALPNNLPRPLTSFVGRRDELADVKALLPQTRLLTLTGAGGCGKTRLALQIAADALDAFPGGVWFADLAPLTEPEQAAQTVALTVGARAEPHRPLEHTLAERLNGPDTARHPATLLILDNCEHLIDACAQLAHALMIRCPALTLLATSREPLHAPGEIRWPTPSLMSLAPDKAPLGEKELVAVLAEYDAVRLFVERAHFHAPGFTLTRRNAPAVVQICHQLDGIPLAIELAAARIGTLTPDQIAQRLHDRFRLLTVGVRTALPRQQTLRATLDWSYDLLLPAERLLLQRLSVFAGGCTLEAAEDVCRSDDLPDVLEVLAGLVEKSLLMFQEDDDAPRYRLLEMVRQYAGERLRETGGLAEMRARHRDFYLRLAEHLSLWEQPRWPELCEREHDNFRAALEAYLDDPEGGEDGLRLAAALWGFWQVRGFYREGRAWYERALAHPGAQTPGKARGDALVGAGNLANQEGDDDSAETLYADALTIRRSLHDRRGEARCLNNLANVASNREDYETADTLYTQALAGDREGGHTSGEAITLYNLADNALRQGQWERARPLLAEADRLHQTLGGGARRRYALLGLARVALEEGDWTQADALYTEGLNLCRQIGDDRMASDALHGLGAVALRTGRPERAAHLLGIAQALLERLGTRLPPVERAWADSLLSALRAQGNEASLRVHQEQARVLLQSEGLEAALRMAP